MNAILRSGLLFLALLGLGLSASGQRESEHVERSERMRAHLHERWQGKPSAERERLERHLEEFEKLPAETKLRMLERARALRERERSVTQEMPEDLRRRMKDLGPERGEELWRQHLRECFRAHGRELRSRLPEELLRRLEQAPPDVRRRAFERLREERERLGLDPKEAQRLRHMPPAGRMRALRELERRAEKGRRAGEEARIPDPGAEAPRGRPHPPR